jgi:putative ABC transport system substrate-binding protein
MNRRQFAGGLVAAVALSPAVQAQPTERVYKVGFLLPSERDDYDAFLDELRLSGFIEDKNLTLLPGSFNVRRDEVVQRAAMLVNGAADAIVSGPDVYAQTLLKATTSIPIIAMTEDMVSQGLATSLARPGRNITGINLLSPELDGRRQDILIEAVPGAKRMALLADANATSQAHLGRLQKEGQSRGMELTVFSVTKPEEIKSAIEAAKASGAAAVNFLATPLFSVGSNARRIIEHLTELRLPSIFQWPETAQRGALMGYGPSRVALHRQRAQTVAKVLRGANPADMPIEQPAKFELVVNLRTAKAIDHTFLPTSCCAPMR